MNKKNNENIIPAVEKAIGILTALSHSDEPLPQKELAQMAGLSQSTGYRILQTLLKYRWIEKCAGGRYELAAGMLPILLKLHKKEPFWEDVQQILDALARETLLSCKLSIRQGTEQLTVARAEAPGPFGVSGKVGSRFPVVEGSVGAALLCYCEKKEIEKLLKACETDLAETRGSYVLYDEIREIHEKGYVLNLNRNRWKIGAMSIPVCDSNGRVEAALTLLGLPGDFSEDRLPHLRDALFATLKRFH